MDVTISKNKREQRAIRLTDDEHSDLCTVSKLLNATNSDAVAIVFTAIADEYRKDKKTKEINIKIKLG